MKCALLLLLPTACLATQVGDTYDHVVAERGQPASQLSAGTTVILNYPGTSIKLKKGVVSSITGEAEVPLPGPSKAAVRPDAPPTRASVRAAEDEAVARVREIVNQPVEKIPMTAELRRKTVSFGPGGWFHPGAVTPDYAHVDIRATQKLDYAAYPFVSSDVIPDFAFRGPELEFNPNTKLFYEDRTLPKKRLSESEMLEINTLYRKIGECEQQLKALAEPTPPKG